MRLPLLGAALLLAALAAAGAISRVQRQLAALAVCEAAQRGDWQSALDASTAPLERDETGRAAGECRCRALLASDRGEACVELLETLLGDDDWAPQPDLSVHWIQTWRDRGRTREAADLARRAGRLFPAEPEVFSVELATRSDVEDEESVLRELELRLPEAGPAAARMRVSLADRWLLRGDAATALAVLGGAPPSDAGDAATRWFETRGRAFAAAGDLAGVRRSYDAWQRAGAAPAELFARYALTLSLSGLKDPQLEPVALLWEAFEASAQVGDPVLRRALAIRLVLTLVAAGRQEEALALYDRASAELELPGLSRAELERSAAERRLAEAGADPPSGELVFRAAGAAPGDTLWLAPEPGQPPDADYQRLALPGSGVLRVPREAAARPTRWVYRDAAGRVRASGALSSAAKGLAEARIELRPPREADRLELRRAAGDGRRRVFVVLPDCGDWHIVQYLRARGELPLIDSLLREGYRAVLESDPPLTAAALEALVWPGRRSDTSTVGLVHQLGLELAGLSSVGDNPFAALSWLLPEQLDLFSAVGAGPRRAANLLFSHGGIRAGRHGELTGPGGRRRLAPIATSARDLRPDERERWPGLASLPARDAIHLRTIAAELDAAEELAADRSLDLVMLRIEPLDILTHAHFAEIVDDGQDDGVGLLFEVYRYIDARLSRVHDRLDADDVFVLLSDHGIRTAMEHSRDAIFVAVGGGVPRGRADGRPDLRGVPRVLSQLLGIPSSWPDSGLAPWERGAATLAASAAKADPRSASD